jgi:hypothetical protein
LRTGIIRVDGGVLSSLAASGLAKSSGPATDRRARLHLFPDTRLTAVFEHSEPVYDGRLGVAGRIEGEPMSEISIVERDGRLTANVRMSGVQYEIRALGDGRHVVREIDPGSFSGEVSSPAPSSYDSAEPQGTAKAWDRIQQASGGASQEKAAAAGTGILTDVLVAYTTRAMNAAGGLDPILDEIALGIYETNYAYLRSDVDQRIRLAGTMRVTYSESANLSVDLNRLRLTSDGYLDGVHPERDAVEADVVSLWVEWGTTCGDAFEMNFNSTSFAPSAFNVVKRSCASSNYTFANVLGSNMGLKPDWYASSSTSPYDYCHGYVNTTDQWRTIMATDDECQNQGVSCQRLGHFSNPSVTYGGDPMGSFSSTEPADAAKCLNATDYNTSRFRVGRSIPNHVHNRLGKSLVFGDFNGDGVQDLATGAPMPDGHGNPGRVTVLYSSGPKLTSNGLAELTSPNAPSVDETFGHALAVGDFNGDGYDDLAVGSPDADVAGVASAGKVTVFEGSAAGVFQEKNETYDQAQSSMSGTADLDDLFGYSLASADFDEDGIDDLAVGAPGDHVNGLSYAGSVSILYGSTSGGLPQESVLLTQDDFPLTGVEFDDYFGASLAVGNFNGQWYSTSDAADLAIGAPYEDWGSTLKSGLVHVIYAGASGLDPTGSRTIRPSDVGETVEDSDAFGTSLAAGDFDGDYYEDLVIGTPYEDDESGSTTVTKAGIVHVMYGAASTGPSTSRVQAFSQHTLSGTSPETEDQFGLTLAATPGNFYEVSDLAIGSPHEDWSTNTKSGIVHVLYGVKGSMLSTVNSQLWREGYNGTADATEAQDQFGGGLAMTLGVRKAKDTVLAIGAPKEVPNLYSDATGAIHVLYADPDFLDNSDEQYFYSGSQVGTGSMLRMGPTKQGPYAVLGSEEEALVEAPRDRPDSFRILGNAPNPFGERTEIAFTLPEASTVSLVVYDVLGRVVARPIQEVRQQAGTHRVPVDASRWASGTYLYRLTTEKGSETGRMTLVR